MGAAKAHVETAHALLTESAAFAGSTRTAVAAAHASVCRTGQQIVADEHDLDAAIEALDAGLEAFQPLFRGVDDTVRLAGLRDTLSRMRNRCTNEYAELSHADHRLQDVVHAHNLYHARMRAMNVAIAAGATLDQADAAAQVVVAKASARYCAGRHPHHPVPSTRACPECHRGLCGAHAPGGCCSFCSSETVAYRWTRQQDAA